MSGRLDRLRGGLYRKYSVYFVTAVCSAVVIAGGSDIYLNAQALHRQTLALLELQAAVAATKVADFMDRIESEAESITALPSKIDAATLRTESHQLLRRMTPISHVRLLDKSGREQAFVSRFELDRTGDPTSSADDPAFQAALGGRTVRNTIYFRRETEPYMSIAIPRNGGRDGVAVFEVNLKPLWRAINPIRVGETGYAYAVDRAGTLVSHRNVSLVLRQQNLSERPQVARALAALSPGGADDRSERAAGGGDGTTERGTRVLAGFVSVPKLGWIVLVEQARAEADLPVDRAILQTTGLMLGGLVLALGISLLLARRMTQPIQRLRQGAERFAQGELEHRIDVSSRDELQELAERFNAMAGQLREAQATLERKVDERTRELQLANLGKSRFLAAAGHDLRQPVHAIGLLVSTLRLKLDRDDLRALAAQADQAIGDMRELLDNLLDMSRLEAGTSRPSQRSIALERVFEQVDFAYAAEADSRHLDLRVMHTERTAISDPVMLGRILQNLVANAVRHTPSGKILVGCRPRGQDLAIEVWDTGTGIAAESLHDIFREFVKLKSGAPSPGLGLGLYIVKGLADQLGHRLEVCSRVGKGSVFRLLVPMSERSQTATGQAPSRDALPFAGRRVLIVDDDPTVLAAMRTAVESWGCEVAGAGNAREALEVALGGSGIELVLCDHELPGGMTGLDVLERVRAGSHQAPPALLVTGNTSASLQRSAEAAGYKVLHKPVEAGVLREAIAAILGGNGASARPG